MKLITALILSITAITAQAGESVKIPVDENSCWAEARSLAKTGSNYQETKLGESKIVMFQTKTHHVTASCRYGDPYMFINKISNAEMASIRSANAAKTASLAKQAGL